MTVLVNSGFQVESEYGKGTINIVDDGKLIRFSSINLPSPSLPIPIFTSSLEYLSINSREPSNRINDISFEGSQNYIMTDSAILDLFFLKTVISQVVDDVTRNVKVYTARTITDSATSFITYYKMFDNQDYDEQYIVHGCIIRSITIEFSSLTSFLPTIQTNFNGLTLTKLTETEMVPYEILPLSENITSVTDLHYFDWDTASDGFEMTELIRNISVVLNMGLNAQEKDNLQVSTQKIYDGNYSYTVAISMLRGQTNILFDYVNTFTKNSTPINVEFRIRQGDKFQKWTLDGLVPTTVELSTDIEKSQIDIFSFSFNSIQVDVYDEVTDLQRSI